MNAVSREVIDSCIHIHKDLGPGLFESVYEKILIEELLSKGLSLRSQIPIPVYWNGKKVDHGFRADLLVENSVLIELKSIESVADIHKKQLLTYLKLSKYPLGLLINFNVVLLKSGITRLINTPL